MRITPARTAVVVASCLLGLCAATVQAAPSAPAEFPSFGTYKGQVYDSETLVNLGLTCNVDGGSLECFDSAREARRALADAQRARGLEFCEPLSVYQASGFAGGSLQYNTSSNLPVSWRNTVSSWRAGCRFGKLFDGLNQTGASVGLAAGQGDASMTTFNNRADSVYRG